jgi:hypothetical protein
VIEEGRCVVMFIALSSIEESRRLSAEETDREDAEEFISVDDVEVEEQGRLEVLAVEMIEMRFTRRVTTTMILSIKSLYHGNNGRDG